MDGRLSNFQKPHFGHLCPTKEICSVTTYPLYMFHYGLKYHQYLMNDYLKKSWQTYRPNTGEQTWLVLNVYPSEAGKTKKV